MLFPLLSIPCAPLACAAPTLQESAAEALDAAVRDANGQARIRLRETVIGYEDPALVENSTVYDPNGRHMAYVIAESGGMKVVADGVPGTLFEGFAVGSLVYSPDGGHVAYVGTLPGSQCVVLDGEVHPYEGVSAQGIVFSSDGHRTGWVANREKSQFAVIDGVEGPAFEGVVPPGILFSVDGHSAMYTASSGGKKLVVLDGVEGPLLDQVSTPIFAPSGHRCAYFGNREGKVQVVVDGEPGELFEDLLPLGNPDEALEAVRFSANGSRAIWGGRRAEGWFVLTDGREYGPFEELRNLALSPEGSHVAYLARRGESWAVYLDDKVLLDRFPESMSFSADGQHWAVVFKDGNKAVARIDGVESPAYDAIDPAGVLFSSDGSRNAFVAKRDDQTFVVVDGKEGPGFRNGGKQPLAFIAESSRPVYSFRRESREVLVIDGAECPPARAYHGLDFGPKGLRYCYAAEIGDFRNVIVVDGVEYGPAGENKAGERGVFRLIGVGTPMFSPDGLRVAWTGSTPERRWMALVDGRASKKYVVIRPSAGFSPDSRHLSFLARSDTRNLVVVDDLEVDGGWEGFVDRPPHWSDARHLNLVGWKDHRYYAIELEML